MQARKRFIIKSLNCHENVVDNRLVAFLQTHIAVAQISVDSSFGLLYDSAVSRSIQQWSEWSDDAVLEKARILLRSGDFASLIDGNFIEPLVRLAAHEIDGGGRLDLNEPGVLKGVLFRLRATCFAFEIREHMGANSLAQEVLEPSYHLALHVLWQLKGVPSLTSEAWRVGKQCLWVLVHRASLLSKISTREQAQGQLTECRDAVSWLARMTPLSSPNSASSPRSFFLSGLSSRLHFIAGQFELRRENLELARKELTLAIEQRQRAHDERSSGQTQEREADLAYSIYQVGRCLGFGLSQVSIRAGQLSRARASLAMSRLMVQNARGDRLTGAYLTILYAQTLRKGAGTGVQAISQLDECERLLKTLVDASSFVKERIACRLQFELAMTYLQRAKAESRLPSRIALESRQREFVRQCSDATRAVAKAAEKQKRDEWRFAAQLLRCTRVLEFIEPVTANSQSELNRLVRRVDAVISAAKSLSSAKSIKPGQIAEAYLIQARAEKLLFAAKQSVSSGAQLPKSLPLTVPPSAPVGAERRAPERRMPLGTVLENVAEGIVLAKENVILCALLHFSAVDISLELREMKAALRHLSDAEKLIGESEHTYARECLDKARENVRKASGTFFVNADHWPLNYPKINDELRQWLITVADEYMRSQNQETGARGKPQEAHDLLGVSRATVFNWRKRLAGKLSTAPRD
jgi:hypothetical protein